jgi:hypothetical protein
MADARRLRRAVRARLMFRGWQTFLTLAGLFLLGVAGLGWGVAGRFAWREALLADAVQITATVRDKRVKTLEITEVRHGNGQTKYYRYLTYAFRPAGHDWLAPEVEVSPGVYRRFEKGEVIPIEYARKDPTVNRPLANRRPHRVALACIGPAAVTLIALILLRLAWTRAGRDLGDA